MRFLVGLIVLALLVPAAQAAPLAIDLRMGDAPATDFRESDDAWHITYAVTLPHAQGNATTISVPAHTGALQFQIFCTCSNPAVGGSNGTLEITVPAEAPSGDYTAGFVVSQPAGKALAYNYQVNTLGHDPTVTLRLPAGTDLQSSATGALSQDGTTAVHSFDAAALGTSAWFVAGPSIAVPPTTVTETQTAGPTATEGGTNWFGLIGAFAAGIVLWALLVQRGVVQKRSRKQVAAVATHKTEAQSASKEVLEARKRALMAGLKDVEKAKMMGEMDTAAYDVVKAELKKQTVTVMRALEEKKDE